MRDFCKRLSLVEYSPEAFHRERAYAELFAEIEDLRNHAEDKEPKKIRRQSANHKLHPPLACHSERILLLAGDAAERLKRFLLKDSH